MPINPNPASKTAAKPVSPRHRPFRIVGVILAVIVALIVIVVIVLPLVITPNAFKPRIERAVHSKTGRELSMPGNIHLSMFPWLGVQIGPMSLSNAPGFGNTPFASMNETDVHVRFWPLLHGKIEVGAIKFDGLNLDLERNASGHNNWQGILDRLRSHGSIAEAQVGGSPGGIEYLHVQGLHITNSGVRWSDAQKHQQYIINNLNLEMGAFAPNSPLRLRTDFDFTGTNPQLNGHADLMATVVADVAHRIYIANDGKLDVTATGDGVPGGRVNGGLLFQQAAVNLNAGTLALSGVSAHAYGLTAQMDLEGENVLKKPDVNGTLKLAPFSPRDVLQALGRGGLANTRDPSMLAHASGSLDFVGSSGSVSFENIRFKLDKTAITGSAAIKDFNSRALAFNLNLDRFNADDYLPPQKRSKSGPPREQTDINKISVPLRTLRSLNLDGQLHIGQLTLLNTHSSNVSVTVSAHHGVVHINSLFARLYGGSLSGIATVDAASNTPVLSEAMTLENVELGGLVGDLFKTKRMSGTANLYVNTRALGPTVGEIRHTLDGRVNFAIRNGVIDGINVWGAIERAYALMKRIPAPPPTQDRTEFTDIRGSAIIRQGVLDNHDFRAQLPSLNLIGAGKLDLAELTLDYRLKAHITGTHAIGIRTNMRGLVGEIVPLRITGTLSNLRVRPNLGRAIRAGVGSVLGMRKAEFGGRFKGIRRGLPH